MFLFQAITGLNGMQLGEKKLIVQRASVGAKTNMNNVSKSLCQAGLEKITLLKQFCFFQIFWSPEFKPILNREIWVKYSEADLLNYLGLYPSFKTKANSSMCVYTLQKKTFWRCIRTFFCHTSTKDGEEMQQKVWYICIFVMDWINISLIHLPGIKFSISFVSLHIITYRHSGPSIL